MCCYDLAGVDMEFDELFGLVKDYSMEQAGIWQFFSDYQHQFRHTLPLTPYFFHLEKHQYLYG